MKDGEKIKFVVFRFDPKKDSAPYFQTYEIPYRRGMTVLDGLRYIFENIDHTLSIRFSCRQGICGSDGMLVNGKYALACQTQISEVIKDGVVKIEPMPHYPVIKDLVVDLTTLYEKLKKAKAFFMGESVDLEREYLQTPKQRAKLEDYLTCVLCGACVSACPVNETDWEFLGPAPLMRAFKYLIDNRDKVKLPRIVALTGGDGIYRCHLAYSCVDACPKELPPAIAIRDLQKIAFKVALTGKL